MGPTQTSLKSEPRQWLLCYPQAGKTVIVLPHVLLGFSALLFCIAFIGFPFAYLFKLIN